MKIKNWMVVAAAVGLFLLVGAMDYQDAILMAR